MRKSINKWLNEVVEVLGLAYVHEALNNLIYADETHFAVAAFKMTVGWAPLSQLRKLVFYPKTNQEILDYLNEEANRYIRLSEMGNYVTALALKKEYTNTLDKVLPGLNLNGPVKALLKNEWVINLLWLKHTSIKELQMIESEKPFLLCLLSNPEIPDLILEGRFKMQRFIDMSDSSLLTIGFALSKIEKLKQSLIVQSATDKNIKSAEAICDLLENESTKLQPLRQAHVKFSQ